MHQRSLINWPNKESITANIDAHNCSCDHNEKNESEKFTNTDCRTIDLHACGFYCCMIVLFVEQFSVNICLVMN